MDECLYPDGEGGLIRGEHSLDKDEFCNICGQLVIKPKKYWYKFYHHECPVCGRYHMYKVRQYGPKPENIYERHIHVEDYDWCDAF